MAATRPNVSAGNGVLNAHDHAEEDHTDGSDSASALPEFSPVSLHKGLHRGLSTRQVSMIAIAGTIGTGLFLGTGQSLAQGGPASMLICYAVVGAVVYVALLLLGEMATQYPIAGTYQTAFVKRIYAC